MKKVLVIIAAAAVLSACERELPYMGYDIADDTTTFDGESAKILTFHTQGGWSTPTFTRATSVSESDMTDVWVLDYMDGVLMQQIHQTSSDADWGHPQMTFVYGEHEVYFVASRGLGATLNTDYDKITWTGPRDTFWRKYELTVDEMTAGNHIIQMDRCCTRLRVTINDEVPAELDYVIITPATWYYGLNYITGEAVDDVSGEGREISVPATYIGTSGQLTLSIFGMSSATEWTTNITVAGCDVDDNILGSASIANAPFKANRTTEYSGTLFNNNKTFTLTLNDEWADPYQDTW